MLLKGEWVGLSFSVDGSCLMNLKILAIPGSYDLVYTFEYSWPVLSEYGKVYKTVPQYARLLMYRQKDLREYFMKMVSIQPKEQLFQEYVG